MSVAMVGASLHAGMRALRGPELGTCLEFECVVFQIVQWLRPRCCPERPCFYLNVDGVCAGGNDVHYCGCAAPRACGLLFVGVQLVAACVLSVRPRALHVALLLLVLVHLARVGVCR